MNPDYTCDSNLYLPTPIRFPMRLYMIINGVDLSEVLNCTDNGDAEISLDIAQHLKASMNRWKVDGLSTNTGRVDYQRLRDSDAYKEYQKLSGKLRNFDPLSLTSIDERLAFWINIYNVMMIHGVIAYGAKDSVQEIRGTFERIAYMIGGLRYSLDDVEHGILRVNRGHIAIPGVRFSKHDPRRKYVIQPFDPRIHFTLVCGSKSCPPIGVYQANNINAQLDLAARNFINNGGVVLNKEKMEVSLSRIFQWYSSDFGGHWMGFGNKTPTLHYISQYLTDDDAKFMLDHAEDLKVLYQKYDWSLNA